MKYETRNYIILGYRTDVSDYSLPYGLFFADSEEEANRIINKCKNGKFNYLYYKFCVYKLDYQL